MTDVVLISIIGATSASVAVFSPLLLSILNARQQKSAKLIDSEIRKKEKEQEYARLDIVAEKADAAVKAAAAKAEQVANQAAEAANLLIESNKDVANTAKITNNKLDVIHTLVNSQLTGSMQSEADAVMRELAMMLEVVELKRSMGHEPTREVLAAIDATQSKISELRAKLADRLMQTEVAAKKENELRDSGVDISKGSDG